MVENPSLRTCGVRRPSHKDRGVGRDGKGREALLEGREGSGGPPGGWGGVGSLSQSARKGREALQGGGRG